MKNPNLFQDIQLDKIFHVLGKPNERDWQDLRHLPDWKMRNKWKNTLLDKNWASYPEAKQDNLRAIFRSQHVAPEAFDLLCKLIEYDPTKRITAAEALEHPYFKLEPKPGKNIFVGPDHKYVVYPVRTRKEPNK